MAPALKPYNGVLMNSDFLYIGNKPLQNLDEVELSSLKDLESNKVPKVVLVSIPEASPDIVLNLPLDPHKSVFLYIENDQKSSLNEQDWYKVFNTFPPFKITFQSKLKIEDLNQALLKLREKEQLVSLQKLRKEKVDSELKVKKENIEHLEVTIQKLRRSNRRFQLSEKLDAVILKCLETIFNSENIAEIEESVFHILEKNFDLKWLRILISPSDLISEMPAIKLQKHFKTKIFELEAEKQKTGKVIFAFEKSKAVRKSIENMLQEICDAIALRTKQIITESEIETSQKQWEITFHALPFKAAVIDKNYRVIQRGGKVMNPEKNKNKYCYKEFFKRKEPCPGCKLGENFLIEQNNESLEVNSKEIFDVLSDDYYFLNFYRDFDVSTLNESGKAMQTKLEELGVISGSIAHELNNPLGGIKILLELMKEDPSFAKPEAKEDLEVMMQSTEKCIHIVKELLNFTRKGSLTESPQSICALLEKLQTFTGAYLLSFGIILKIYAHPLNKIIIQSGDNSIMIKLLEGVAQFAKNLKEQGPTLNSREIYAFSQGVKNNKLFITFSESPPRFERLEKSLDTLSFSSTYAVEAESTYTKGRQSLTLKFPTEVKANGTHV